MARDERKSWMTDHNASVVAEMKTGADPKKLLMSWYQNY